MNQNKICQIVSEYFLLPLNYFSDKLVAVQFPDQFKKTQNILKNILKRYHNHMQGVFREKAF